MVILKIDKGFVDDDFVHSRQTLMVLTNESPFPFACKLYDSGRLCSYTTKYESSEYSEEEIPYDMQASIKAFLGM
ncbi:MAG TPA: hypothetical protein VD927_06700 [Chryseosolibacter sp.]|nr:hypothetical protein [Chryseosolibacter sp.]